MTGLKLGRLLAVNDTVSKEGERTYPPDPGLAASAQSGRDERTRPDSPYEFDTRTVSRNRKIIIETLTKQLRDLLDDVHKLEAALEKERAKNADLQTALNLCRESKNI